jgi:hypothetical protein
VALFWDNEVEERKAAVARVKTTVGEAAHHANGNPRAGVMLAQVS